MPEERDASRGAVQPSARTNRFNHVWFAGLKAPEQRKVPRGPQHSRAALRPPTAGRFSLAEKAPGEPDAFLVWLFARAGLDARTYSPRFLQRRLSACLRVLKADSTDEARRTLERRPELMREAMSSVLIGVSGFFRDAAVFDRLRASVLPGLLKRANGLRVCSLGCSEGQELYSITMLIDELGALEKSDLLGVDCRREAIARARAGWVEGAELEKVPLEFRERYFIRSGLGARVVPRVRESTRWQEGNCLQWDYSRADWDVILFRNVAIYLKREEAVVVWQRVAEALKPGGVLVTGKAEQPPKGLPLKRISHCLYIATERAADKSMML